MYSRSKTWRILATLLMLAALAIPGAAAGAPVDSTAAASRPAGKMPEKSGVHAYRTNSTSTTRTHTDCPQAGINDGQAPADQIEAISDDGDDRRANQDLSCFPQDETSIAINPTNTNNILGGANDYRLGFGSSGFYSSFDGGLTFRDGILAFPSLPNGDNLDGGGDPAITFDRQGYAYYADINFNRTDDTNGVFVHRSSNGGRTFSRPCVPIDTTPGNPTDNAGACGSTGDVRTPGDGVVNFYFDNDTVADGSVPFNDKEYIAAGPRPAGVAPQCFGAFTRTQIACGSRPIGVDRIYVTWSLFNTFATVATSNVRIMMSYSDDRGVSWSRPKAISGSAPFCTGAVTGGTECSFNQASVPTVHPTTGALYVAFENFNTPDENQYVMVRSTNGGRSFTNPRFITSVFDVNYPRSGVPSPTTPTYNRPDCAQRGQGNGRSVLTNSCFRVNSYGNIVVDKRGGTYANDVYVVISDNRAGTPAKSNTDIYFFKSTNGGDNWTRATRVNNDPSRLSGSRNSGTNTAVYGKDQWFPWIDTNASGDLNVVFYDRRLDANSVRHEWPQLSRQFPGNYLTWFWGAQCRIAASDDQQQTGVDPNGCVLSNTLLPQPTAPVNPGEAPQSGQNQSRFPFRNFVISDVPSNMDYAFRAGIFIGDYNNVAVRGGTAIGFWTDARNGRSTRSQPGRNPICEQSDVYLDRYAARGAMSDTGARSTDALFLKANCP